MKEESSTIPLDGGETVSGVFTIPDDYAADHSTGVILAHGAANSLAHPLLAHVAQGLAEAGYLVMRFNFLYREKGRKAVDRQEVLVRTWQSVYGFLGDHPRYRPKTVVAGGKSLGGRVASQMAAEGILPAEGMIFLGYPLHPPGKKEKLRDAHLYRINIPMLFFAGTRDSLCDLELLRSVLGRLAVPWQLETIEGADHSFRVPKSAGVTADEIHQSITDKASRWLQATLSSGMGKK
ncbi:MAG: dienelactone hydrolase family protein [Deltaproteobacteria bacterium]|nr:dienelactone hydrolase family protein [Deltaproteobacteria bacterium]